MVSQEWYILAIITVAVLATLFWRVLGVYIGRRLESDHWLIEWASALAYSTVAALTVKMVVFPEGILVNTELWERLVVVGMTFGVFFATKKNVLVACLSGVVMFGILMYSR